MAHRDPRLARRSDPLQDLLDEKSLVEEINRAVEGNDCPGQDQLESYLRQEIREPERREVKSHLTFCGRCQKRARALSGAAGEGAGAGKGRRGRLLSPGWLRRLLRRALVVLLVAGLAGGVVYLQWRTVTGDFPYGGKVVFAEGELRLAKGIPFQYEVRTPRPIYLIQITLDGEGRIDSSIPPGPQEGKFRDCDRLSVVPRAAGVLDFYLVPCPASQGSPDALLTALLAFIKTEQALSRENKRQGIETALALQRVRYLHEVVRVLP